MAFPPLAQNQALLRRYQLQFGRALPQHYFTIQHSHYVKNDTGLVKQCDGCGREAKVHEGYIRQEGTALPHVHEYICQIQKCDACMTKPAYDVHTIHEIHRKLGFHLQD